MLVADVLRPVEVLAVQRLLDGDMRHRRRGRRAMPMLLTRGKPDHITRVARIGLPPENGLTLRQRANAQAMMPTKRLVGLGRRKNVI